MSQRTLKAPIPLQSRRVWMTFPGEFKKRGAALLHQQCWCWGCDIRRQLNGERANLLLEMGFERTPPPDAKLGATMYQKRLDDGQTVTLWGFGMCFGDDCGGIFISRFAFWPRWGEVAAPKLAFGTEHLAGFRAAKRLHECQAALDYFGRALHWIADYERQIETLAGPTHRENALQVWGHTVSAPDTIPRHWEKLAGQTHELARFWKRENNATREISRARFHQ